MTENPYERPESTDMVDHPTLLPLVVTRSGVRLMSLVSCAAVGLGFSTIAGRWGMFALLPAVCVCSLVLSVFALQRVMPVPCRKSQRLRGVVAASVSGSLFSPLVMAFEWSGLGHPWPESDSLYVLFTTIRCLVSGAIVGYMLFRALEFAQPQVDLHTQESPSS